MSSYIMHMCISDIVKKKLNLTDKFTYGSILPDLLKATTSDRKGTHYLEEVVVDGEKRKLPNINKAIDELNIQDKEIRLGYIAHLIEDLIWFNEYIPTYTTVISDNQIKYLSDGSIHTDEEFRKDIYSDYINSSEYVVYKCNVDVNKLKSALENIMDNLQYVKILNDNIVYSSQPNIETNKFMTKESVDQYIKQATKEVEKVILKLLGE